MKNKTWLPYLVWSIIVSIFLGSVVANYRQDRQKLVTSCREVIEEELNEKKRNIEVVFRQLYQSVRTMSLLPAIRSIDRYGENLSEDSRMTIQQIYNNTAENIGLSEIYAVDIQIDPDRIDPHTQKPMEPIFTYDQLIVGKGGENQEASEESPSSGLEEVEIYEYREMREQTAYFRKHFPRESLVKELKVPAVISKEVITCDNTEFTKEDLIKGDDSKRNGLIYSVPFYSREGILKGMMSAVIRTEVLKSLLAENDLAATIDMSKHYGLVNAHQNYRVSFDTKADFFDTFAQFREKGDFDLLYIKELTLNIVDSHKWKLVCYVPMSELSAQFKKLGIGLAVRVIFLLIFLAAGLAFIYSVLRQKEMVGKFIDSLDYIGEGDLTRRITGSFKGQTEVLISKFNRFVEKMEGTIGQAVLMANEVAEGSQQIAAGNEDLSQRSQEQASTLEETASTIEQLTANLKNNAENSQKADRIAKEAVEAAHKGEEVVQKAVTSMSEVTTSSQKISEIITVVNDIAFQTNLLALNAAVEAARAGEQGRGFAVVAGEVRILAGRSAAAAKEIQQLINDSVDKVKTGHRLVEKTGQTLNEIIDHINLVAEMIAGISSATQEQSSGIDQVNLAITQIDRVVQQNASLVEETAATSQNLSGGAKNLDKMMSKFKVH